MSIWRIRIRSLLKEKGGITNLYVRAKDEADAWQQARWRLGSIDDVIDVKEAQF